MGTVVQPKVLMLGDISEILPHREDKLLIESAMINPEFIKGRLLVTQRMCAGHAVLNGNLVLRGADLLDMAAQLLALFMACQRPELKKRLCFTREYGVSKFYKLISPGNAIFIEAPAKFTEKIVKDCILFAGGPFCVKDKDGELKARIESVTLVVF